MSRFEAMWDRFWTDLPQVRGASPWDVDPTYVAHAHLHLFGSVLDPTQPVIDVGCGDGAQTVAISQHFDRVIGVDVAPSAVERARKHHGVPGVEYEQLDLLQPEQAKALHERIGDAGLYVRTVLHAFTPEELKLAATSLAHLAGGTGGAFFYELAPSSREFILGKLAGEGVPAEKFGFVFDRVPLPVAREEDALQRELEAVGFEILSSAPIDYQGTVTADGRRVNVPAFYVVARARDSR
ncbi:class I SAM-dependent methyltransferase [Streptomyces sp. JJ38]|uniref:class I SAM-dependent methyltransferase n=1 Tax=Streptomyces sp. JJ38 TaxID=2738128 RepID=UPI001C590328|nr:class I SAM-dependent methyltransferase [Streptomyces sp. JJ38]MBW1596180.1 class I SAM-dependent methyltransferase [Streptomyces sp. JJ38]